MAIIFGGRSSEHEVSRRSAVFFVNNISKEKYNLYIIGITKKGEWFLYNGPTDAMADGSWENSRKYTTPVYISPNPSKSGIVFKEDGNDKFAKIDVAIPVLHGRNGEDGTMQGLFEIMGIPYVGSNTLASACCMDKITTNILFEYNHIPQAKFSWFTSYEFEKDPQEYILKIERELGDYPFFVKPSNAGSSVGVGKAHNRNELVDCIKTALKEDNRILIEEAIVGQEVECAILGNNALTSSVVGEIASKDEFYDYNSKYVNNTTELFIPAHIDDDTASNIRSIAKKAYSALGCSGLSRVDFFVEKDTNRILLNEINTFPGFTSISMYPMLMQKSGIPIDQLIERLIELAFEKGGLLNE